MTYLYYIRYFFYIAINWNFRLALFSIFHEINGEKKYGIRTTELDNLKKLTLTGKLEHAEIYQGASYYLLEHIFQQLKKQKAGKTLIDVGCGKGRAMVVAAEYGFTKITGIDFARQLCDSAIQNCGQISRRHPSVQWQVIYGNAEDAVFAKDTRVFFFFNPFKEAVMAKVIKNILISHKAQPRKIYVAYVNPQLKHLLADAGFKQTYYIKKMNFVEAGIYEKV